MILNTYEHSTIHKNKLPNRWRSQKSLLELDDFLQKNWEQRLLFYDDKNISKKQQFLSIGINGDVQTKKYIGTIVFEGEQLNIYPKVFRQNINDKNTHNLTQEHLMKNLLLWLTYCQESHYPFLNIPIHPIDSNSLRDLFLAIYIFYVKDAVERNTYYQYVDKIADISFIRGKFNYKNYILKKIPNGKADKFQCLYSAFLVDNLVNRIIKYTLKLILNSTSEKQQKEIQRILFRLADVTDIKCVPSDCDRIRLSRIKSTYRTILDMSKIILLNNSSGFFSGNNLSICFLFPAYLLFQAFIGGFLKTFAKQYGGYVKLQYSRLKLIDNVIYADQTLGPAFPMRLDILVELNGKMVIMDTKYKMLSRFEGHIDSTFRSIAKEQTPADIYQVCEYARKYNVSDVYLLYPMFRDEDNEPCFPVGNSKSNSGDINIHFVRIPFIFEDYPSSLENRLSVIFKQLLNI